MCPNHGSIPRSVVTELYDQPSLGARNRITQESIRPHDRAGVLNDSCSANVSVPRCKGSRPMLGYARLK